VLSYLPALVAVAALVLTYLFCIRPMRGGTCLPGRGAPQQSVATSRRLELAPPQREELRQRERVREQRGTAG
jgi:hypothetical protein